MCARFRPLDGVDAGWLGRLFERARDSLPDTLDPGPAHRRRLEGIDLRIAVSGTRGKSTATRWLHDVFHRRGYDTFAKVTGDRPLVRYNGSTHPIDRSGQVRLYENRTELARFDDRNVDVAVVENQGIREYTTRLVNQQFVAPDVVFLTNVREDHLDTLGRDRGRIARSLARAVPRGTTVVNGERDPAIRARLEAELDRRDAETVHVEVPPRHRSVPGAEVAYGVDAVLRAVGASPLSETVLAAKLDELTVEWRRLPGGRVYNAAPVNDVQSTEIIRQTLAGDTLVEPVLFLRADRRGRTASFVRYLDRLFDRGLVERVHLLGADQAAFDRASAIPVERHDREQEPPGVVLEEALASGRPVLLMGNTVDEYMRDLRATIAERGVDSDPDGPRPGHGSHPRSYTAVDSPDPSAAPNDGPNGGIDADDPAAGGPNDDTGADVPPTGDRRGASGLLGDPDHESDDHGGTRD
jgi:hypothetical protein